MKDNQPKTSHLASRKRNLHIDEKYPSGRHSSKWTRATDGEVLFPQLFLAIDNHDALAVGRHPTSIKVVDATMVRMSYAE